MAKVTEREAAKALGKSRGALQDARKRGDLARSVSRDARGRLLIDVDVAREELEEAAALRVTSTEGADETLQRWRAARARLAEAQAVQAEDDLRKRRGELVEVADIEARLVTTFTAARTKLLGVPTLVRQRDPSFTTAQLALLEDHIREALEDLAAGKD